MFTALKKYLFRPTLSDVTASFTKAIDDLKNIEEERIEYCIASRAEVGRIEYEADKAWDEIGRAASFRKNLEVLLGASPE